MDYCYPERRIIELAVIKREATDAAQRIGTLFFNPGGPGGAGTALLPLWYEFFPREVRERFDIISWDPRGVGQSTVRAEHTLSIAEEKASAPRNRWGFLVNVRFWSAPTLTLNQRVQSRVSAAHQIVDRVLIERRAIVARIDGPDTGIESLVINPAEYRMLIRQRSCGAVVNGGWSCGHTVPLRGQIQA